MVAWLLAVLASSSIPATAQSVEAMPGAEAQRWVAQRIRAARLGRAELVEVPLAFASLGWGCECPPNYLGYTPDEAGVAWVEVEVDAGVTLPEAGRRGAVRMVRGYFTGSVTRILLEEQTYRVLTFVVTALVRAQAPATPRLRVVAGASAQCTSVVQDETPLRVRATPAQRAAVVGEIPNDTPVTIIEVRGDWLQLSAPTAGWVWAANVLTRCTAPTPPPTPPSP